MITYELPPAAPIKEDRTPELAYSSAWRYSLARQQNVDINSVSNLKFPFGLIDLTDPDEFCYALGLAISEQPITEENMQEMIDLDSFVDETQSDSTEDSVRKLQHDSRVRSYLGNRYADLLEKHDELVAVWPKFIEIYENGIQNGIAQGYLPADLLKRFRSAKRTTSVQIMDSAAVQTLEPGAVAFYSSENSGVFLDHQQHPSDEEYLEDLGHEFGHDISGGTYLREIDKPGRIKRIRLGYSTEVKPNVFTKVGLNEAINHHVTLGILTGDFENLNPAKREDGNESNLEERMIYGVAVDNSRGLLTVKDLTLGIYEDTGPGGSLSARKKMLRGFTKAYGFGAIKRLELLCGVSRLKLYGEPLEPIGKTLGRIHSPMVDENGKVTARGYIDMSDLPELVDMVVAQFDEQAIFDEAMSGSPYAESA